MGGMGKWVKKNPLQTVGLVAGAALGVPALAGLLGPAATVAGVGGANVGRRIAAAGRAGCLCWRWQRVAGRDRVGRAVCKVCRAGAGIAWRPTSSRCRCRRPQATQAQGQQLPMPMAV